MIPSAKYRERDEVDLAWSRIRRRITRELDIEIANKREEVLNVLLSKAWTEYTEAIGDGRVQELESKYANLVTSIVTDILDDAPKLEPHATALD